MAAEWSVVVSIELLGRVRSWKRLNRNEFIAIKKASGPTWTRRYRLGIFRNGKLTKLGRSESDFFESLLDGRSRAILLDRSRRYA